MFLQVNLNCYHVCSIILNVKPVRNMLWNILQQKRVIMFYPYSADTYCIDPLDLSPSPSPPPHTFYPPPWRTTFTFVGMSDLPIRTRFRFRRLLPLPLQYQLSPLRPSTPPPLSFTPPTFPLGTESTMLDVAGIRQDLSGCDGSGGIWDQTCPAGPSTDDRYDCGGGGGCCCFCLCGHRNNQTYYLYLSLSLPISLRL